MEGASQFEPQGQTFMRRNIEANVVHHNPEWRIRKDERVDKFLYLLPSRLPPAVPVVIRPKDDIGGGATGLAESPWLSNLTAALPEPDETAFDLEAAFGPAMNRILREAKPRVTLEPKGGEG